MYTFELPFPPTINHYYKSYSPLGTTRVYVAIDTQGKKYRQEVINLLKGTPTLQGDLKISIVLHPHDNRRRDLDNFDGKALLDSLTHAGVWQDDRQIKERHSKWGDNISGGKAVITIEKMK